MTRPTAALALALGLGLANACVVEVVRTPYEPCTSTDRCTNGSACIAATYSLSGQNGALCSASCLRGDSCPFSGWGSLPPTCVVSASTGQGLCYDTCASAVDCVQGTRCARIPGSDLAICVPEGASDVTAPACGGLGMPCCLGGACTAGLACTRGLCSGVTPNRRAYQKCDVGDVCGDGTACIPSVGQVSGEARGRICTRGCPTGASSVCPGFDAAASSQAVACVNLTGNALEAQCFRLCVSQADCAPNATTCAQFATPTGPLRVCVPVGPRG